MSQPSIRRLFLILFYFVILFIVIVMPILGAFDVIPSNRIDEFFVNVKKGFSCIPSEMWAVFGLGYSIYTGARTYEKSKGIQNK